MLSLWFLRKVIHFCRFSDALSINKAVTTVWLEYNILVCHKLYFYKKVHFFPVQNVSQPPESFYF